MLAANKKGADQTAWMRRSVPLLLACDKNRFSHGVTLIIHCENTF